MGNVQRLRDWSKPDTKLTSSWFEGVTRRTIDSNHWKWVNFLLFFTGGLAIYSINHGKLQGTILIQIPNNILLLFQISWHVSFWVSLYIKMSSLPFSLSSLPHTISFSLLHHHLPHYIFHWLTAANTTTNLSPPSPPSPFSLSSLPRLLLLHPKLLPSSLLQLHRLHRSEVLFRQATITTSSLGYPPSATPAPPLSFIPLFYLSNLPFPTSNLIYWCVNSCTFSAYVGGLKRKRFVADSILILYFSFHLIYDLTWQNTFSLKLSSNLI